MQSPLERQIVAAIGLLAFFIWALIATFQSAWVQRLLLKGLRWLQTKEGN